MHYKAPDNSVHFIEDPSFEYLLPAGSVPITDEEAAALTAPPPPSPKNLLDKLDGDNVLTQRNLRETVMLMTEAFKTVSNGAIDLSQIPGVAKVYEVEAQAAVLRGQL